MNARAAARATSAPAKDQGYKVIADEELVQITEGRVRQLEAELASHRGLLEEMEADPNQKDDPENPQNAVTQTRATIESLEKRLGEVLHPRLDALRSNVKTPAKDAPAPSS
jgi:hypothetical protein